MSRPTAWTLRASARCGASWSRRGRVSRPRSPPCWPNSDLFGVGGKRLLDELQLDPAFHARVLSLRRLIDAFDFEVDVLAKRITAQLARHPGFKAIQAIDGVGPLLGMVFVAEIGDVTRFQVLELLVRNAGRVLTRSQIIDRVWGPQIRGRYANPRRPR